VSEPTSPGADDPSLGDVLDFMRLLWAVDHALQQRSKQMLHDFGVTGPQRLVLRVVGRFPGIAAGKLAGLLHVHPSTLTGVLKRLEDHAMLERTRDPDDARRSLFVLSARGKKLDATKSGTVEHAVRKALAQLAPADVQAASRVLRAIADSLGTAPSSRG
jgi:DNA-binding MarR family transcriptional regulator